ncbi:lipopolysaccharide heptosyltransferase II [Elusimicrobiota bacterium]
MHQQILILRLSSLGDVVLLGPALKALKKACPASHITAVTKKPFIDVLSSNPDIDKVIAYNGLLNTYNELKSGQFDCILDFHGVIKTRLLSMMLTAKLKACYSKNVLGRYLILMSGKFRRSDMARHVQDRYLDLLKTIGIGEMRVLVMQTAFLGDAVLTLPLLKSIKERLSSANVYVLSRPEHHDVFAREGFCVIIDDKRTKNRKVLGFINTLRNLKRGGFDLAIIPHRSFRSALLAWLAQIPQRIGFSTSSGYFFLTSQVPFNWEEHDSERNLKLLDRVILPSKDALDCAHRSWFTLADKDHIFAQDYLQKLGVDPANAFIVGIAPGSKWPTKSWPVENFLNVVSELKTRFNNIKIVLIGSSEDKPLCDALEQSLNGTSALNLAGKTTLKEIIPLMSKFKLFLSNDSGPMHIACGLGIPTVAVFGPTVREFGFFPKSEKSILVESEDLSCRPCSLHGGLKCPRKHFLCMRLIRPEDVMKACEKVLSSVKRET